MYRHFPASWALLLAVASFAAPVLRAQTPAIAAGGIFNTASYTPTGLPGAAIAQGSLFVIFGSNMGPGILAAAPALPLTTSLNGTSMSVTVAGTTTKPLMVYTSARQVGAIMPSNTPVGTGTLTLTFNGVSSAPAPVTVAATSVGIFTLNQAGSGPGIITTASYAVNTLTTAASAGDVDIIWATGLGPVGSSGSEASGTATLAALPSNFAVYVGGVSATIVGAARTPGDPGLDQIAFKVPAGVSGCDVPVVIQTGNIISNYVSMAIGTGGVCSNPTGTGLTPTQLTALEQKGSIAIGGVSLSRSAIQIAIAGFSESSTTDIGGATFSRYTTQQYNTSIGGFTVSTFGACSVYYISGSLSSTSTPTDPIVPTALDAGQPITVTGPNGAKTLSESSTGTYSATLGSGASLYLSPGTYTVAGPGGKDVGAFSTSITLPPTLTWTNAGSISTVTRANGQPITWTGGDPNGTVDIIGIASVTNANSSSIGALFECTAQTSAGSFTIPAPVLLALPVTSGSATNLGLLEVGASSAVKTFTATGLDLGILSATVATAQTVVFN
jgi:uncharacterized protein (TIGR03437 family)